jgi:hypothetical protein
MLAAASDYYFMLLVLYEKVGVPLSVIGCPFQNNTTNRVDTHSSKRKLSTYLRL